MAEASKFPADWTQPELWVWERIAAGELADLNARDRENNSEFEDLDPRKEKGWAENRRLRVKFLQTILTQKTFTDATPYGGVRILGALVDDAPLDLEYARLQRVFWLERSRILVDVKSRNLRIDGEFSLEKSLVAGEVDLRSARIGSDLGMGGSTFEKKVILNAAIVDGAAFLRGRATFKGEVDLTAARVGGNLEMGGSTFEKKVILNSATVDGSAFLRSRATFKGEVDLGSARIGSSLDFSSAIFSRQVDLTGCKVIEELRLGSSGHPAARWENRAALVLRNTHVGAMQDWWRNEFDNAWPKELDLEGFTYDRLGGLLGEGKEANMMARPVASYIKWLGKDPSLSPQPYEHLASIFRRAGEPRKASDILYEARERRRRTALSTVDDLDKAKNRDWTQGLSLWVLRLTIGYGLGNRYFRALFWVGGFSLLGTLVLIIFGQHCLKSWPSLFFASLDQLLPIITLDKAHDALIFGDSSAKPNVAPQRYLVLVYFYFHRIIGWVLGSFIVAGLAGLTQRN